MVPETTRQIDDALEKHGLSANGAARSSLVSFTCIAKQHER